MKTFAIRCFIGRERKKTHLLTKQEARIFRKTALHLARYLKRGYKL